MSCHRSHGTVASHFPAEVPIPPALPDYDAEESEACETADVFGKAALAGFALLCVLGVLA